MRLFQNFDIYPAYLKRLHATVEPTHYAIVDGLIKDRFIASHMLLPTLARAETATCSIGHDVVSQRDWARRHGMAAGTALDDILRAQIEEHRTEVFYNHDPLRFGSVFLRTLPGSVRKTVAWRAAPSPGADFVAYDKVVCNFPSILADYRARGWSAGWFAPAHDPEMDAFDGGDDRPVDVLFAGSYSQFHGRRGRLMGLLADLGERYEVVLRLNLSRMVRLAETPAGLIGPLRKQRLPQAVRKVSREPVFGRDLYRAIGRAKIVVNGAIDMAGEDRGNIRCWEAMGCGALLLSDAGRYPEGMEDGRTLAAYRSETEMVAMIEALLADEPRRRTIAAAGHAMIGERYSKERQWRDFVELVA